MFCCSSNGDRMQLYNSLLYTTKQNKSVTPKTFCLLQKTKEDFVLKKKKCFPHTMKVSRVQIHKTLEPTDFHRMEEKKY